MKDESNGRLETATFSLMPSMTFEDGMATMTQQEFKELVTQNELFLSSIDSEIKHFCYWNSVGKENRRKPVALFEMSSSLEVLQRVGCCVLAIYCPTGNKFPLCMFDEQGEMVFKFECGKITGEEFHLI